MKQKPENKNPPDSARLPETEKAAAAAESSSEGAAPRESLRSPPPESGKARAKIKARLSSRLMRSKKRLKKSERKKPPNKKSGPEAEGAGSSAAEGLARSLAGQPAGPKLSPEIIKPKGHASGAAAGREPSPPAADPPPPAPSRSELEEKLKKALSDRLYLKADFENFKKHAFKERRELALYEGRALIRALADEVLDDLDRSLEAAKKDISSEDFKSGVELIHKKLRQTLARFGVTVADPRGSPFDPESHEAVGREKTARVPEGHVSAVLKKVYIMRGRVIRPGLVIVAEKPDEDPEAEGGS